MTPARMLSRVAVSRVAISRVTATLSVAGLMAGALAVPAVAAPAATVAPADRDTPWQTRLIGEQIVPKGQLVDGMALGELSGLDYDRVRDRWVLLADDAEKSPARFFTARFDLDAKGFHDADFTGATALRRTDGSVFPSTGSDDQEVADPESIRISPWTKTLLWSSEGRRDVPDDGGTPRLTDPWVRQATPGGHYVRQFGLPDNLRMSADERGPRQNQVFEGMTYSADGRQVVASMEGPLYQDGPQAADGRPTPTRLTFFDALTGKPRRQAVYELSGVDGNGVPEILAVDRHRYLVLERAYSAEVGNTIRVFEIDVRGATDVLRRDSLENADYRPVRKRLVVDFADLGLDKVDNIEGMGWGPRLAGGERSIVFCSDDNFNDTQISQLVALGLRR